MGYAIKGVRSALWENFVAIEGRLPDGLVELIEAELAAIDEGLEGVAQREERLAATLVTLTRQIRR